MIQDAQLIQQVEFKADSLLQKAQQYLTTALPGGPGVFAYVVMSNLVGKLFGNTKEYVEQAITRPVSLPDFVYVEPLDEELEEFFDAENFTSLRAEFPDKYENFSLDDWTKLRRYYKPLYYTLYYREPFMTEMFAAEVQSQNYKRIIQDYELLPLYKQALDSIPSASRQNALWSAVSSVLKDTVDEVWSKDYAKELFEEANTHPEVAELVENIKAKVSEKVELEKLQELRETVKYITGRSISAPEGKAFGTSLPAVEYVATVSPSGEVIVPAAIAQRLQLAPYQKVRILMLQG